MSPTTPAPSAFPPLTPPSASPPTEPAPSPATPIAHEAADRFEAWDHMVERELRRAVGDETLTLDGDDFDSAPCRMLRRPPRDLTGLALSGGGNRSATFNLGLLQGLADLNLLPAFDYLSTVSGGGYVGAFWSAWQSRTTAPDADRRRASGFPVGRRENRRIEAPEIRHLREFSNFLSPRVSLLSWDTGRMITAAVSGLVPAFAAALGLVVLGLGGWLLLARGMFPDAVAAASATRVAVAAATAAGAVAALLLAAEWVWRRATPDGPAGKNSALGPRATWTYVYHATAAVATVAGLWAFLVVVWLGQHAPYVAGARLPVVGTTQNALDELTLLLPALPCAATAALFAFARMLLSRYEPTTREPAKRQLQRARRSAGERVVARLVLAAASWTAVAGLWIAAVVLSGVQQHQAIGNPKTATGAVGLVTLLTALFTWVQKLHANGPLVSEGRLARLRPVLPQVLAYAVIGGLVVITAWALTVADPGPGRFGPGAWAPYAAAAAVTCLTLAFFNPNVVGLHAFYRARLSRAYLGASNATSGHQYARMRHSSASDPSADAGGRQSEEQPDDDILVTDLAEQRPVHLVCCAANDVASRDPVANLRRGAHSAVLSAFGFSVADSACGWTGQASRAATDPGARHAREHHRAQPPQTLGAAITASGAAFNSQMGELSIRYGAGVTFLMAALNLRLGRWVPHPDPVRRADRAGRALSGLAFYRELFGLTSTDAPTVHLSDGGHFENLAVYELVRRQCRHILVSDCGADPTVAFDDFGRLVRRVRQDFGVEIDVDLSALRPGPDGRARQHMVAGDIHYPTGDVGVLLYVKPAIVGDEPADVAQYRARNSVFPHESTGDQFYDEAQWESYRRLGLHTARSAFYDLVQHAGLAESGRGGAVRAAAWRARPGEPPTGRTASLAARMFAAARREWQPLPPDFGERAPAIAERIAALDAALGNALDEVPAAPTPSGDALTGGTPPGAVGRRSVYWECQQFDATVTGAVPLAALEHALPTVRKAALCMEEAFEAGALGPRRHPAYVGVSNYFARWATTPALRFWWPVLRGLHPPGFVVWAEHAFGLPASAPTDPDADPGPAAGRLQFALAERPAGSGGFVEAAWAATGPRDGEHAPQAGDTRLQLDVALPWAEGAVWVGAAQLFVRPVAAADAGVDAPRAGLTVSAPPRVAAFEADWLFVPPGLREVGVAEVLLSACRDTAPHRIGWAAGLLVRVPEPPRVGSAQRRESAMLLQMLRAQGFRDVWPDAGGVLALWAGECPGDGAPFHIDAAACGLPPSAGAARWLYRGMRGGAGA